MGFSSVRAMDTETVTYGKSWQTLFQKTTGAVALTAGRWYDLSMCIGTPRLNVYPGGMTEATRLWYKSSGSIYSGQPISPVLAGSTLAISAALALTDSANGCQKAGFYVGQTVTISGFSTAGNNGTRVIATISAGSITFSNTTGMAAEAAGDDIVVSSVIAGTKHISCALISAKAATTANSLFMLCDYLMFYPLFDGDSDAYQEATTPIALPRYPTGAGVQMFAVTTSDLGDTPGSLMRITYTNSSGVTDRMTPWVTLTALAIPTHLPYTGVAGGLACGPFIPLQDGDTGVRSIQGVQLSMGTGAGWICIVLCKPMLHISNRSVSFATERCMMLDIPTMPKVEDEAFLSWLYFAGGATAAGSLISGGLEFKWGNA